MATHSSIIAWRIPLDRRDWQATVHRVAKSWTRLKRLSSSSSMDSTVHGILQASTLEWVVFPFSRGFSQSRDRTQVSCIAGRFFTAGSPGKPISQSGKAGQRSLVCCSPWGNKELDTAEQLNSNIRQNTVNCRFSLIL